MDRRMVFHFINVSNN